VVWAWRVPEMTILPSDHLSPNGLRGDGLCWALSSAFSVAAIAFDLTSELATGKGVISGPTPGSFNRFPVQKVFAFLILIGFELVFLAGFLRALRPSLRLTNMRARRDRRQWMLDPSRSGRPVRARTLGDLLGEGGH